jgi:hypothetical protein
LGSLALACFFITEINGNNRKKQKFVRYAHLLASLFAMLILLAGARISFISGMGMDLHK